MLLCFFLLLINDLHFLITAAIRQIFIVAELAPTEIPTKEAKSEIETHPVTVVLITDYFTFILSSFKCFFCFIYFFQSKFLTYVFFNLIYLSNNYTFFWYSSILLTKLTIFTISVDSFSLNILLCLLPHSLQIIKITNVL